MTEALPRPLVPLEVDLTDFHYMELDVRALRDSKFASEVDPEAFRAGVLLWCAAWHQIPAGSLPDNDKELSNLAGFGRVVKQWKRVRDEALSLFVKCSDGRLYHQFICEKALAAWDAKLHNQWGKACERLRKENKQREEKKIDKLPIPSFDEWNSARLAVSVPPEVKHPSATIPPENALRGNRTERNGEGTDISSGPDGPAAAAAALTKAELWAAGKSLLAVQGMPKPQCGSFVGKLCKDYGDDVVIDAVRAAVVQRPADAAQWLVAACQRKTGRRGVLTEVQRQSANEAANAEAKRLLGIGHQRELHA